MCEVVVCLAGRPAFPEISRVEPIFQLKRGESFSNEGGQKPSTNSVLFFDDNDTFYDTVCLGEHLFLILMSNLIELLF